MLKHGVILNFKFLRTFLFFLLVFFSQIQSQNLNLQTKIAQMLMMGFSGTTMPDTLAVDLNKRGLGGVILFAGNVTDPQQLSQLTTQLKNTAMLPLLISIDEEGGRVARLNQNNGYEKTYSAFKIGTQIDSMDTTMVWSTKMAGWLKSGGINVNFAPVVDVDVNHLSPAIGALERSFSADPMGVFKHANLFINEFSKKGIVSTLKHFPGHGSAIADSHLGFTDITSTWSDSELIPYQKLFAQGFDGMTMVGHLYNKNLDSIYPASLSYHVITELLRKQLGFNGVVITDALFMKAISDNYPFDQVIELAINAGNDILLYTTNIQNNHSLVDSIVTIVMNKISEGKIKIERIDEANLAIAKLKQRITSTEKNYAVEQVPKAYTISSYPNPFNPVTTIAISLPQETTVDLKAYNITGELVREIFKGELQSGKFTFAFNGTELPSGIYFISMIAGKTALHTKLLLLK